MLSKDVAWVQVDVSDKVLQSIDAIDKEELFFLRRDNITNANVIEFRSEAQLLVDIMNSLGFTLVRMDTIIGKEKFLFAYSSDRMFPYKTAYYAAGVVATRAGVNMRGMLMNGHSWLHMLESKDSGKTMTVPTLSLQNTVTDGSYVIHDMKDKEVLVHIDNTLSENDRDALLSFDEAFGKFFEQIDYALATLKYQ